MSEGLAVIVPAHNSAAFLAEALESVAAQSRRPDEIVVVDDGSTDGSHRIAERMGVACVRQEQRGPGAARNRGMRETSAPLIAFLDADDWFAPEKLKEQVALLRDRDVVACCSDARVVRDGESRGTKNQGREVPGSLTFEHLLTDNPVICSTVVVRRTAVDGAGGFDEDPRLVSTEDYDLWLRIARLGGISYDRRPLAVYRVHTGNLSGNLRFVGGIDRIMDKVVAQDPGDLRLAALARRRRAGVRLDAAYDLVRAGQSRRARELLREARRLGGWTWRGVKTHLRSLV